MRACDMRRIGRRVRIAQLLLALPFVLLAARAAHLSVVDRRGAARGAAQTERVLTLAPQRGAIMDRSGAELALSIDAPSVYATRSDVGELEATVNRLAPVLGPPSSPTHRGPSRGGGRRSAQAARTDRR